MRDALFTTDLHFTDAPREAYRFQVFDFLEKRVKAYGVPYVFLLGDLTDKTDRHSSRLVNEIVPRMQALAKLCQVFILRGNHDYVDPQCPYFRFLNEIEGMHYILEPTKIKLDETRIYLLPHTRHPEIDWKSLEINKADIAFMHQTLAGARAENGRPLEGEDVSLLSGCKQVFSGDVHVPQQMGNIIYVGSPYHVHFGDSFVPRIIHYSAAKIINCLTTFPSRLMLNVISLNDLETREFKKGDQCKLNVVVTAEQWPEWPRIRQSFVEKCAELGLDLCGIEPTTMWQKSSAAPESTFMVGTASPKEQLEKFLTVKYPSLGDPYMNVALEIVREVDGLI